MEQVVGGLEGDGGGDQGVGHRQVEDVDVGGRLHLGVSAAARRQREHHALDCKRYTSAHLNPLRLGKAQI